MAGVAENLNVHVTLTHEKPAIKWCAGGNDLPLERLLRDYQVTFPLHCGNFILTATIYLTPNAHTHRSTKYYKYKICTRTKYTESLIPV